ncbi:MAG: hypothetical protein HC857_17920 [Synechococcales cyanobacterium RU_4_20]|nr:hypothetical protein [Synechococcales cyanobacterium RU_4_20]NJR69049.1 hypothetical protein [Synechococcales cyanobacterium CRU_2_2]
MNAPLAEKLVCQLSGAIADILPVLEPQHISPETKAAISKLLFAIGKFVEHRSDAQKDLEDTHLKLHSTALDGASSEH